MVAKVFIARQRLLLDQERKAEIERSSLLLSNCGPKLLEQKGLSLGGLGIIGVNIGLGGKTYVLVSHNLPSFHILR
jgi:DNA polymerase alpha-associated DNA helicase A